MARVKEFDERKVLEKALQLFWHKGYNGTSAQDLVSGLGISRSSLYDTFGDKRTLYIKALNQYQQQNTDVLLLMAKNSEDAKATIKQIFQGLLTEGIADPLSKGCFMVNTAIELAPHDEEINAIVSDNMKVAEEAFYLTIKKGQKNGQLSAETDARSLARFLFNNVTGLRVAFRSGKDKKYMDDIVRTVLAVVT